MGTDLEVWRFRVVAVAPVRVATRQIAFAPAVPFQLGITQTPHLQPGNVRRVTTQLRSGSTLRRTSVLSVVITIASKPGHPSHRTGHQRHAILMAVRLRQQILRFRSQQRLVSVMEMMVIPNPVRQRITAISIRLVAVLLPHQSLHFRLQHPGAVLLLLFQFPAFSEQSPVYPFRAFPSF